MSFAGYLFGNVDEEGRLDNDLDDDLRETLQHVDADVMSKIFNPDTLGLGDGSTKNRDDEDDEDGSSILQAKSIPTIHSSNAVDYSDFNETVPDDYMYSDKFYNRGMGMVQPATKVHSGRMIDDNYDEDEDEEISKSSPASFPAPPIASPGIHLPTPSTTTLSRPVDITAIFPAFEKDKILRFSDLFMTQFKHPYKYSPSNRSVYEEGAEYDVSRDDEVLFNRSSKTERLKWRIEQIEANKRRKLDPTQIQDHQQNQISSSDDDSENWLYAPTNMDRTQWKNQLADDIDNDKLYDPVMLNHWESQILWDSDEGMAENYAGNIEFKHLYPELFDGDWTSDVRWSNDGAQDEELKISLDLNDPHMLFDCEQVEATKAQLPVPKHVKKGRKPIPRPIPKVPIIYNVDTEPHSKLPLNRFNQSGDKFYDALYINRLVRVRATMGELEVAHALPAIKLNPALFKTRLSKSELRSFHRHLYQPPLNTDITFSRVRAFKRKKKDKKKPTVEFMRTTKDMSLKETCPYVLMEYSEENPPIISNPGMGTLVINYYRKTEPKDDYVPTMDIGEPVVLDVGDTSPFLTFGNVEPGQTISMYHNNLVRAPLFRQDVKHTDFLFVKSTYKGQSKYYLREIPAMFVVGQTYPVQEVPGPQSRKITATVKGRVQIVAYRLIRNSNMNRLRISKLCQRFPEYSELQIRQRLKEFLEFDRKGRDGGGGYWRPRGNGPPPDEETLRKLVSPEMVCLYESMLVGERHLQDLGYSNVNEDDDSGENDMKLEVEQQLAPWFITRNFINASQGKAMLKLYGAGDPTGRGEGFSFIRVSMKDVFLRAGESAEARLQEIEARPKSAHRYNVAEQQQIYREEIARIWSSQLDALSSKEEPTLSDHESESEAEEHEGQSPFMSPSPSPSFRRYDRDNTAELDDDALSATGSTGSRTSYHANNNKQLVIRRQKLTDSGEMTWVSEIINDPVVMKAYLQHRQMIEEEASKFSHAEGMDEAERRAVMQTRIRERLDKLKRTAERRRQRQLHKQAMLAENPVLGLIRGSRNEGAIRRCGNCGQLGHMKTNKRCPKYYEMNNPQASDASTPQPPLTPSQPEDPTLL
ncbi:hypothetical protein DM01DRAFT_1338131 [Hesseltinella vesiculosa]|uniref:Transcription initiation factor TFIID subunit 1 histone acetyltransferase domain-containing protein n=1 Tax=Hesseltinella vesiculosa TaxID=101127 RepID=A0A1X2GAT4_9FUNG|nr:hypothetical protein DM01DRAFT_1338131 [Hesseltinella vesiculosa]